MAIVDGFKNIDINDFIGNQNNKPIQSDYSDKKPSKNKTIDL